MHFVIPAVNLIVFFGMFAVLIPVIIHLLNRRRYQVVEWGAMQFLQINEARKRRMLIDELLLMLLRMFLIALMVLALTALSVQGPIVAQLADRPNRDVVLVFDGSYSMGLDDGLHPTPHESSVKWASQFLKRLSVGDRVALVQAGYQPKSIIAEPAQDLQFARTKINEIPPPTGACNGPEAVFKALEMLQTHGEHSERDVIILTDGHQIGWADAGGLDGWKKVASRFIEPNDNDDTSQITPRIWLIHAGSAAQLKPTLPNYALSALTCSSRQGWVGQMLAFDASLRLSGKKTSVLSHRLRLEIDGKFIHYISISSGSDSETGRVPISFSHTFSDAGPHRLSLVLEPTITREKLLAAGGLTDFLPADNRCDLAIKVQQTVPVLLVDGDGKLTSNSSTFNLRAAFSEGSDQKEPARILARTVTSEKFVPEMLSQLPGFQKAKSKPQVLILADVPRLSKEQIRGIERFLKQGGSVLAAIGKRVTDAAHYNRDSYRNGQGWLPARLVQPEGDVDDTGNAASPNVREFQHPALNFFLKFKSGTLERARIPRWWKVAASPQHGATIPALLTSGHPMLVERPFGKGKVILCTAPLDTSWNSNLARYQDYPVMLHQLVYYLAGAGDYGLTVKMGESLRYQPYDIKNKTGANVKVVRPGGVSKTFAVREWPFDYVETTEPGIYRIGNNDRKLVDYVVRPDRRESNLTALSKSDRDSIKQHVPLRFGKSAGEIALAAVNPDHREYLWWLLMLGVVLLLCVEIWMTRRMVLRRGPAP